MLNEIDLSRTDLNLLVLFDTVMETRHVGRAAERLSLTPSAVSHGLGRLRTMLGDPLFTKTPKGVAPTQRAHDLAAPIADVLARVKNVVATRKPFDAATSTRRFAIGAPDGVSAVFLGPLLSILKREAPNIDISIRQVLPREGEPSPDLAWRDAFTELDARVMDCAVIPIGAAPARFAVRALYEEEFVIAMRARHPFVRDPSLKAFCAAEHLVVSHSGDPMGFVDTTLAQRRMSRRVAVTAPNFLFALAMLAESDLISALPGRFVARHSKRFGIVTAPPPLKLPRFHMNAIAPRAALEDVGLAWLVARLEQACRAKR